MWHRAWDLPLNADGFRSSGNIARVPQARRQIAYLARASDLYSFGSSEDIAYNARSSWGRLTLFPPTRQSGAFSLRN